MPTCSGATCGGCDRGGDMAGGGATSAGVGEGATARERRNGERGTEQKLTADSAALTESSGMHWRRRGGDGDPRWLEVKKATATAKGKKTSRGGVIVEVRFVAWLDPGGLDPLDDQPR